MPRFTSPSRLARPLHWQHLLRAACAVAVLGAAGCAETPQQQAYHSALAQARTDPAFCYAHRYDTILSEAMQRAQAAQADTASPKAEKPDTAFQPTAPVTVTQASAMPDLSLPPYFQRACRLTVQKPDGTPESGFLTFTYLIRNGDVQSALSEWHSDTEVSQKYATTMKQIEAGLDMSNPDLKACIARYPAFDNPSKDPMVQKAAFDLRAHLVRRCMANKAALKDLYSDLYFIHR
ncbi:hypothetical protein OQ252_01400 [Acetobacter farinalis]|uniref:Lipoprotein n=1 Tax=Acetobacter farinalis TaxID=1260984 RepID=A0ABT3Q449_9PROT|nr:hypothetical protein [Acetobacter farinalis]MCX2560059.1 hypothetical protein [Acetobacter farinalis]NHO28715.1 hypothetical protein [Acetobacter farinalis]